MHILLNIIYFFIFLFLAFMAMFLGGVSGVAGTFYLMVKEGTIQDNLEIGIAYLLVGLVMVLILRRENKKVLRQKQRLEQEMNEQETDHGEDQ